MLKCFTADQIVYRQIMMVSVSTACTVYPEKYAHGFCFAVLCCGYTLTDFPISIRLTSLALWQSNDCPSASKATLMNMDKYFMWIHYERLHNHNKAKHNKTVCIFLGIYCMLRVCCVMYALRTVRPLAQIQGPALICDKMFSLKISWNSANTISIHRVALKIDRLCWNACQMPGRYITSKYKFGDLEIIMISCLKRYWNINTYVLEFVKRPFCVEAYGYQNSHDLLGQKGDKHTCIVRYLRIYDYPGQWNHSQRFNITNRLILRCLWPLVFVLNNIILTIGILRSAICRLLNTSRAVGLT